MNHDKRTIALLLSLVAVVFAGCIVLSESEDLDALDNGTSSMSVTQGSSSTYTWAQAFSQSSSLSSSHDIAWGIFATTNTTGVGNSSEVSGLSASFTSTGIKITASSSVSAGTYYLKVDDFTVEDTWTASFKVVASGGSGGSTTTNYTVSFSASSSSYGSVSKSSITVAKGTTYSASGNKITFSDGQSVTATAKSSTSSYTYSFDGWSSTSGTISSAKSITANFSRAAVTPSTISITVYKGNWASFSMVSGGSDTDTYTSTSHTYTVDAGATVDIDWKGKSSTTTGSQSSGYVTTTSYDDHCYNMVKGTSLSYPGGGSDSMEVVSGGKYYPADQMESTSSTTYYFKISYNANGGSGAPSTTDGGSSSSSSKSVTLSSTKPTRSGYTFLGWSTDSSATSATYSAGSSYSFSYGTTPLYAVWQQASYTCYLAYNANGGSGAPSTQSYTGTSTSNHTFTISSTQPTKTGYTFKGWADSSSATTPAYSSNGTISVGYNVTKTIYAVWEKNALAIGSVSKQYAVVNDGVTFTANCSPSSGVTYSYSNATSGLSVTISGSSITLNASSPGTYTFTLTASKSNYDSSSTTVTVEFVPELAFSNTPAQGTLTVW